MSFLCEFCVVLCESSKGDLALPKAAQGKVMYGIFKSSNGIISCKDKLHKINIVLLSLYQEPYVVEKDSHKLAKTCSKMQAIAVAEEWIRI